MKLLQWATIGWILTSPLTAAPPNVQNLVQDVAAKVAVADFRGAGDVVGKVQIALYPNWRQELSRERFISASYQAPTPAAIFEHLRMVEPLWDKQAWEEVAFQLVSVRIGLMRLDRTLTTQVPPMPRIPKGEANALPSLEIAARKAYEAHDYTKALEQIDRAVALVTSDVPITPARILLHQIYTLKGMVFLAQDNETAALDALASSAPSGVRIQFCPSGPRTALAAALLTRGHRQEVLRYFESCQTAADPKIGQKLTPWIEQIRAGKTPDFGPLVNIY